MGSDNINLIRGKINSLILVFKANKRISKYKTLFMPHILCTILKIPIIGNLRSICFLKATKNFVLFS